MAWTASAVLAGSGLLFASAIHRLFRLPYEDAFIHFRIARNLAETGQPYFNVGERVMGSSSPLWTVLLAAGLKLVGSPGFVALLEAASVVAAAVLAWRFLGRDRAGAANVLSAC